MDTSTSQPPSHRRGSWLPIPVMTAIAACTVFSLVTILGDSDSPSAAEKTPHVTPKMTVESSNLDALPTGLRQIYYDAAANYDYDSWPASSSSIIPGFVVNESMLTGLDKVEELAVVDDERQVYFAGWHDGQWDDLTMGRAMYQYMGPNDDGTHMLRTLVAQQVLQLKGTPDSDGAFDEDTLSITVTRFESAIHARHYMLAVLGEFDIRSDVDADVGLVCLRNEYDGLGEVNFVRRQAGVANPNGYHVDQMLNFIRKNLIVTIELGQLTDDPIASPAEIAIAIDAYINAITPQTPVNVDALRPSISITFSKSFLYVGSDKGEETLALTLRGNYAAMEIDVSTYASNPFIHGVGFTETTVMNLPVVGGTPGVIRSAYEPGEFPVAVWALDSATMVPGVKVVWVDCVAR